MKIIKSCEKKTTGPTLTISQVAIGTVFRYADHSKGPYLRVSHGIINLESCLYYVADAQVFHDIKILPDAHVVTGEKE